MPTQWESFPVRLAGGLVSNLSRLQQGLDQPGSARVLINFEPSIKGGYRRISGFTKFDETMVQPYGSVVVQASGQTGSVLNVADVHETPVIADTFTIAGVAGTYTVTSVTFDSVNKTAVLSITPALDSSPADKAAVTFTFGQSLIEGVHYSSFASKVYTMRGGTLWSSSGSGWTKLSTPDYGTPLVSGAGQAGATLVMDGIASDAYVPQQGDTFSVAGIEQVYTVLADTTATTGAATLSISPSLASSPADNAVITFLSSTHTGGTSVRFTDFNFDGTFKTVLVDNFNKPAVISGVNYKTLQGSQDVVGAEYVASFKDHLFFAKGNTVVITAPFDETSFSVALGAASYRLPNECTGLKAFRDQLINFTETNITRISGSSSADWRLDPITTGIGCVQGDTIQEVGGDILFLAPDGIRFLGATDRIGDFSLALASRQIQEEFQNYVSPGSKYCSLLVREKNQYRLMKYVSTTNKQNTIGYIGTQFLDQNAQSLAWSSTKGIKAYRASSAYSNDTEVSVFTNDGEYVYRLESGSDFDGLAITSAYSTPFMAVNDPSVRKTAYKVKTYFDPEGVVTGTLNLRYDFNVPSKIQPKSSAVSGGGSFTFYGGAIYGASTYGGVPDTVFETQVVGSFFTASLQYVFEGGAPFTLDTIILEYSTEDKK